VQSAFTSKDARLVRTWRSPERSPVWDVIVGGNKIIDIVCGSTKPA